MSLLDATVTVPEHVVFRPFARETVILNLETGRYHGINPTGGRMLETLKQLGDVREASARLAGDFDRPLEEVEQDICHFCSDLVERGLIVVSADGRG